MIFNTHSDLAGRHAFLSASNYHWVNYNEQKLANRFKTAMAAKRGSDLHALAHEAIRLGIKLGGNNKTLQRYVQDGIGYRMVCEQPLYYSDNAFGTPDTIIFRKGKLRIHDLKTGWHAASMTQLDVYSALFCLEYQMNPFEIEIEERIYQNDEVQVSFPEPEAIVYLMEKIKSYSKIIDELRMEMS